MAHQESSIVVGIDFSPGSERAIAEAVSLAKRLQASLHVVHVYEPYAATTLESTAMYEDVLAGIARERKQRERAKRNHSARRRVAHAGCEERRLAPHARCAPRRHRDRRRQRKRQQGAEARKHHRVDERSHNVLNVGVKNSQAPKPQQR